jgi:hypothetical protein
LNSAICSSVSCSAILSCLVVQLIEMNYNAIGNKSLKGVRRKKEKSSGKAVVRFFHPLSNFQTKIGG